MNFQQQTCLLLFLRLHEGQTLVVELRSSSSETYQDTEIQTEKCLVWELMTSVLL